MEEKQEGRGTLVSDRTKESWSVDYKIVHTTEVLNIRGAVHTHRTSVVAITATATFMPGRYTLETSDGEYVPLQYADGQWEITGLIE